MKTSNQLTAQLKEEILRDEVMSVDTFLSYFDLYTSEEVNAIFLEESIESYITYFFSTN